MDLQQYLKKEFHELTLFEDSFHGREFVIHLELENKLYQFKDNSNEINTEYFSNVYNKATEVFEGIFKENDEKIYLVSHIRSELSLVKNKKTNIFKRYLQNQKDVYKLRYKHVILDSEEQIVQYSVLLSNKNKLNYKLLIKAICNQDFRRLQPRLNDKYTYYPEIFFINKRKNVILNIYDDRGCFVLFKDVNDLNSFKEKYKGISDTFSK